MIELSKQIELAEMAERELYTAVVSDALDQLGVRHQAMREYLRPVHPGCVMAGWARTVTCSDIYHIPEDPYGLEIEAIDSLQPGEICVVGTQKSTRNAPWGELLSTASKARGARGAVVDGLVRDIRKIESMGRGIVTGYNVPVECGEVIVNPGDFVFGDHDGIIVIPAALVEEVLGIAADKVRRENHSRAELQNGAYLRDVFAKYGVL
jgi:regulator of RNase E activity RraA